VKEQADYFLQPANGAQRMKLNGDNDEISKHVGHHVRVEGNQMNAAAATNAANNSATGTTASTSGAETNDSSSTGTSTSTTAGSTGNTQEIQVTRVNMVSETCPADMQSGSSPK
jgi:hypothetical protein